MAVQKNETNITRISDLPNPAVEVYSALILETIPIKPLTAIKSSSVSHLIDDGKDKSDEMSV